MRPRALLLTSASPSPTSRATRTYLRSRACGRIWQDLAARCVRLRWLVIRWPPQGCCASCLPLVTARHQDRPDESRYSGPGAQPATLPSAPLTHAARWLLFLSKTALCLASLPSWHRAELGAAPSCLGPMCGADTRRVSNLLQLSLQLQGRAFGTPRPGAGRAQVIADLTGDSGTGRDHAWPGGSACVHGGRGLDRGYRGGGRLRRSLQQACLRSRRPASASAHTAPPGDAFRPGRSPSATVCTRPDRPSSSRPASFYRPRSQSRPLAALPCYAWRSAPALSEIFPGKIIGAYQEDGGRLAA